MHPLPVARACPFLPAGAEEVGRGRSRSLCRPPDHPFLVLDLARRPLPLLLTLLEARSWTRSSGPEPKHLGSQAGHPSAPCSPGRQTCPRQAPVGPVLGSALSPESPRLWISSEVPIPPPGSVSALHLRFFSVPTQTRLAPKEGAGRGGGEEAQATPGTPVPLRPALSSVLRLLLPARPPAAPSLAVLAPPRAYAHGRRDRTPFPGGSCGVAGSGRA